MIENDTNWLLFRLLKVRAQLADSSVLLGVALLQLPLMYHEADKIHGPRGSRQAVPLIYSSTVIVGLLFEQRQANNAFEAKQGVRAPLTDTFGSCFLTAV